MEFANCIGKLPDPLAECFGVNSTARTTDATARRALVWVHFEEKQGPKKMLDLAVLRKLAVLNEEIPNHTCD